MVGIEIKTLDSMKGELNLYGCSVVSDVCEALIWLFFTITILLFPFYKYRPLVAIKSNAGFRHFRGDFAFQIQLVCQSFILSVG